MTKTSLQAADDFAKANVPEKIVPGWEALRKLVRESWFLGFEGKKLRTARSRDDLVMTAWAAGRRFAGAASFVAPDACAEVPKPQRTAPCRHCKKLGRKCPDCLRQLALL